MRWSCSYVGGGRANCIGQALLDLPPPPSSRSYGRAWRAFGSCAVEGAFAERDTFIWNRAFLV